MSRKKITINKKILRTLYSEKGFSCFKIANKFRCSRQTITNRLNEFKIPLKSLSQARNRYEKRDFNGSLEEKAYILGFHLGDLSSYKVSPSSENIVVRCHTTNNNQVKLIKALFMNYGKITVSKSRYGFNVNCFLNLSFNFLLTERDYIPLWVKQDAKLFWSFFAGYSDAEGSFQINQQKARFKLDSYDFSILKWSSRRLLELEVENKLRKIGKKGDKRSDGTKFNKDLWRLTINKALMIKKFLDLIMPYLRHGNQISNAHICLANLRERYEKGTIYAIQS